MQSNSDQIHFVPHRTPSAQEPKENSMLCPAKLEFERKPDSARANKKPSNNNIIIACIQSELLNMFKAFSKMFNLIYH
jgi:hypothetical protein